MINSKLSIKFKFVLLMAVSMCIFFSDQILTASKLLVAERFLTVSALSEISMITDQKQGEHDDIRHVAAVKNSILVARDNSLSCYGRDGALQWRRELAGAEVMILPLKDSVLLIDKGRGDLSRVSLNNEILKQKKDIGEVREIELSNQGLIALSSGDGKFISLLDENLERVGKIVPPAGDIVRFKFSKTEPRLLVYTTELVKGEFGSYIYHYNSQSQLVSTSDLQHMIVYDFEQKDDLTIIGSDWMTRIFKDSESKLDTRLSTKSEQLNGTVECIGSNADYFAIQTLIAKGENQGRTRMALYDWSHQLVGEQIYDVPAEEIHLGRKYFILKTSEDLTIWNYDFVRIAALSLNSDMARLQWVDTFKFLVYTEDNATLFLIK